MRKAILLLCVLTMAVGYDGVAETVAPTNKVNATSSRWQLDDKDLAKTDLSAAIKEFALQVDNECGEPNLRRKGYKILAAIRQIQDAKEKGARLDEFRKILLSARLQGRDYSDLRTRVRSLLDLARDSHRVWGDDLDQVTKEMAFRLDCLGWLQKERVRQAAIKDEMMECKGQLVRGRGILLQNLEMDYKEHETLLERRYHALCESKKFASQIEELRQMIEAWLGRPIRKSEELW